MAISSNRIRSYRRPFQEPTAHFSANFPVSLMHWLRAQAAQRRVSLAKAAYDLLSAQRTVQEQLATAFTLGPTEAGARGEHLLQVLLERLKDEIARSIDRQAEAIATLREQQRCTQAMIDRAYYGYVLHTPRVPPDRRAQASAEAEDRYRKFIDDVRSILTPPPPLRGHDGTSDTGTTAAGLPAGQAPVRADTAGLRRSRG
jgi:hypothetical protein